MADFCLFFLPPIILGLTSKLQWFSFSKRFYNRILLLYFFNKFLLQISMQKNGILLVRVSEEWYALCIHFFYKMSCPVLQQGFTSAPSLCEKEYQNSRMSGAWTYSLIKIPFTKHSIRGRGSKKPVPLLHPELSIFHCLTILKLLYIFSQVYSMYHLECHHPLKSIKVNLNPIS